MKFCVLLFCIAVIGFIIVFSSCTSPGRIKKQEVKVRGEKGMKAILYKIDKES